MRSLRQDPRRATLDAGEGESPGRELERLAEMTRELGRTEPPRSSASGGPDAETLPGLDPLTGLLDRRTLLREIDAASAVAAMRGWSGAVLMVDINRFDGLNQSLGSETADRILVETGRRINAAIAERFDDVVDVDFTGSNSTRIGRLCADKFLVVIPLVTSDEDAMRTALLVARALSRPFRVRGEKIEMTAAIGIAAFPAGGAIAEMIVGRAQDAVHEANRHGRGRIAWHRPIVPDLAMHGRALEADLAKAMRSDELQLVFQPTIRTADALVVGAEALVRWHHPRLGPLEPARFIPLAEETSLIDRIGHRIAFAACGALRAMQAAGLHLPIALNVSARQLELPGFADRLAEIARPQGVDPANIVIELADVGDPPSRDAVHASLVELRGLGCRIVLDDFGCGGSHVSHLVDLPLDAVAIDRSFVAGIGRSASDERMIASTVKLATALGLETLAEGVETGEQLDFVRASGCTYATGFHISPGLELSRWIDFARAGTAPVGLRA